VTFVNCKIVNETKIIGVQFQSFYFKISRLIQMYYLPFFVKFTRNL